MKNLFGCFGLLVMIPLFVIGALLFNAWYLQVLYNIGLTPVLSQFGVFLPQLGYWVFVLIWTVYGCMHILFNYSSLNTLTKKEDTEKKTYNWFDSEERLTAIAKLLEPIISNVGTKLLQLLILYCAYCICF